MTLLTMERLVSSRYSRGKCIPNRISHIEFEKYVGDKITLSKGNAKKQEKERRDGVREMIEEAEQDDDQSEDMERWEEDMMKFGGAKSQSRDFDPYSPPPNYRPAQGKLQ